MGNFRRHGTYALAALLLLTEPAIAAAHERVLIFAAASTAPAIEALAGAAGYAHVHELYAALLRDIRSGGLGGAIILATRAG